MPIKPKPIDEIRRCHSCGSPAMEFVEIEDRPVTGTRDLYQPTEYALIADFTICGNCGVIIEERNKRTADNGK